MTRTALRVATGLLGLLFILIGLNFLLNAAPAGAGIFLDAKGTQGLATLRADFPAFFISIGFFAAYGAWHQRPHLLGFPILALVIALAGRFISIAIDGYAPTALSPIVIEGAAFLILAASWRSFSRR